MSDTVGEWALLLVIVLACYVWSLKRTIDGLRILVKQLLEYNQFMDDYVHTREEFVEHFNMRERITGKKWDEERPS